MLKEVDDEAEHDWVCDVYDAWPSDDVAVARPIAVDGRWSVDGWSGQSLLPGETARAGDDPGWFRRVHEAFHEVTRGLARPAFLDARDDPWAYGERVAYRLELPASQLEPLRRALADLTNGAARLALLEE